MIILLKIITGVIIFYTKQLFTVIMSQYPMAVYTPFICLEEVGFINS